MNKRVLAVAAHPDDIEFMMAGTLFRLKAAGYDLHYMNVANGDRGSEVYSQQETAAIRREEALHAAKFLGAHFHESICSDLEIVYTPELLQKMTAVVREVAPDILLVQYPFDYMEDHCNAARLAVSAAFCRGMKNWASVPPRDAINNEVAVYHAMPYGLLDPLRRAVTADIYVDIGTVLDLKREMLALHRSQKEWLDASQGMDSYLQEMENQASACGRLSNTYQFAEGWIRHLHIGFSKANNDPLSQLPDAQQSKSPRFEAIA